MMTSEFSKLISPGETVKKLCGEFQFTEGPVWVADKNELLFSDIHANHICRWFQGKCDVYREPSGNSNGQTLDRQGRLITCEHGNRRVSRTEFDGKVVSLADSFEGKRLNSPNDVVCKGDGSIYFTDPPYGVKPEEREIPFQGVYRILSDGKTLKLLAKDFNKPNGLAFSPDEKILYVADTEEGHLRAFDVHTDGSIRNSRIFSIVERPDGMKVDIKGNVYCTAMTGMMVFNSDGKHLGFIPVPERPANCTFGDPDLKTLYITARTSLYQIRVQIPGVNLRKNIL